MATEKRMETLDQIGRIWPTRLGSTSSTSPCTLAAGADLHRPVPSAEPHRPKQCRVHAMGER